MNQIRKEITYWGAGFPARLLNFPCYEDEGEYAPDFPLMKLQRIIAWHVIKKPYLLTGNELAFLRAVADLSRSETARRLGKTRRTIINWEETGDHTANADPLVHIALRAYFFTWIFPTSAIHAAELLDFIPEKAPARLVIEYDKAMNGGVSKEASPAPYLFPREDRPWPI